MKKVLYFDWFSGGTEYYRLLPLNYLNGPGIQCTCSNECNITFMTLSGYDVLVLTRPTTEISLNVIKMAKDMGIKVIADFDDDVLHVDIYNPMYGPYQQTMQFTVECLSLCDEIWVTTDALKKAFRLYNKNIVVIPNAHNDYIFPVSKKRQFNTNSKVAMWRGGDSHEGDMYDIGVPEKIIEMVNENTDWTFYFIGQRFKYLEKRCGDNYIAMSGASTIQFHHMVNNLNPNVFFYPLADTLFNKGKSNISWLEATYAGAHFAGNKNLDEFSFSAIERFDELPQRIKWDQRELFKEMHEISWAYIKENLLLSTINKLREERILNI